MVAFEMWVHGRYRFGIWLQMGIWPVAKTFDAVTHETLML